MDGDGDETDEVIRWLWEEEIMIGEGMRCEV